MIVATILWIISIIIFEDEIAELLPVWILYTIITICFILDAAVVKFKYLKYAFCRYDGSRDDGFTRA